MKVVKRENGDCDGKKRFCPQDEAHESLDIQVLFTHKSSGLRRVVRSPKRASQCTHTEPKFFLSQAMI